MTDDLTRYRALLSKMDWTYEATDDHSVWERGRQARRELEALRAKLDPDCLIWNTACPPNHKDGKGSWYFAEI